MATMGAINSTPHKGDVTSPSSERNAVFTRECSCLNRECVSASIEGVFPPIRECFCSSTTSEGSIVHDGEQEERGFIPR